MCPITSLINNPNRVPPIGLKVVRFEILLTVNALTLRLVPPKSCSQTFGQVIVLLWSTINTINLRVKPNQKSGCGMLVCSCFLISPPSTTFPRIIDWLVDQLSDSMTTCLTVSLTVDICLFFPHVLFLRKALKKLDSETTGGVRSPVSRLLILIADVFLPLWKNQIQLKCGNIVPLYGITIARRFFLFDLPSFKDFARDKSH